MLSHGLAIWALQSGLLMRAVEVVVPAEILAQIVDLPATQVAPVPKPPEPVKQEMNKVKPAAQVSPTVLAIENATPSPNAPAIQAIAPPAPYLPNVPVATVATPAPPAAPKIVLPSSDAEYLSNPKPTYPAMSKRLGEQGKVVVRVLIGADGLPQKSELRQSSGFDRLDESALATVMKWHSGPGQPSGQAFQCWVG